MKRCLLAAALLGASVAQAEIAPILMEACSLLPEPARRVQCLRAAEVPSSRASGVSQQGFASPAQLRNSGSTSASVVPKSSPAHSSGGATCYTGPRGGTYTITASGRKNYNGC